MGKTIKLKKGFDINIIGKPQKKVDNNFSSKTYAIKPSDFRYIAPIPKLTVKEGDEVKAGDPIFYDKGNPDIMFCAPVSGEIVEVKRGQKRAIAEIVILADKENQYKQLDKVDLNMIDREDLVKHLLGSGCWPMLTQRPYGVLADPTETPKAIFVSAFDSAPLANDLNFSVAGQQDYLQAGIDALNILSGSTVYLGLTAGQSANELTHLKNVETNNFDGPHPAGLVGVQIHHTQPINKGDIVWTVKLMDVVAIGRVIRDGQFNTERLFALGGPSVKNPQYYKGFIGANVEQMLKDNIKSDNNRVISGNVLTGQQIAPNGHMHFFQNQVTVLEEGDKHELFGWLIPNYPRPSISKTFFGNLFGGSKKEFNVNTNTHGEHRALVVSGEYEKVLPMDVFPMQLVKSILYGDLDLMEGLGIYEIIEEDLALCEFVCTSKTEVQKIVKDGIDLMIEQG